MVSTGVFCMLMTITQWIWLTFITRFHVQQFIFRFKGKQHKVFTWNITCSNVFRTVHANPELNYEQEVKGCRLYNQFQWSHVAGQGNSRAMRLKNES